MQSEISAALRELQDDRRFCGDIRTDRLHCALYATDASIYEIVPDAVLFPKSADDVCEAVKVCARHRVPITPRGAGTGLAGGAVNRGICMDLSRHLNRILHIDAAARIAVVEPGVVLDELNAALAPHGLQFAADVATSSRATIGGMIANNSCGAHSVMYGRTVDHVLALDVVLADGSRQTWGRIQNVEFKMGNAETISGGARQNSEPFCILNSTFFIHSSSFGRQCEATLSSIASEYAADIAARFPRVLRSNGGYGLDRLTLDNGRINPEAIVCGSEGTLAVVVGAALNLVPLPRHRGIVAAHFHDLLEALAATPAALEHGPAAVELLDKLILDAARDNPDMQRRSWRIEGDPAGLLIIELYDDNAEALAGRLHRVAGDLKARRMGYAWPILSGDIEQADLWHIRKSGLGLLMSRPGDRQTYDFVEDTAVDPSRLRDYIARFMQILAEEGVADASYYAHASVGCLHVKPVLNLKEAGDIAKMHRIADRVSSLALEFGGAMTGEHGDGILRSCWLEKMYGPRVVEAFRRVKAAFDPHGILNPGKIVDPYSMTEQFRTGPGYRAMRPLTVLDFDAHGGMAGLAEMCSGVGQCRQKLVGVMCPSYVATGDERHTTRARANALRLALSDREVLTGLDDPALHEVMDLCISCKACKTECPTGVDMARLKAEWQHHFHQAGSIPWRSRLVARADRLARMASMFPALANAIAQNRLMRRLAECLLGFDRRVPPPLLAARRLQAADRSEDGHAKIQGPRGDSSRQVVYFIDTWSRYFTPGVAEAAVAVLNSMACGVTLLPTACCGRPAISKGALDIAKRLAEQNVALLAPFAQAGFPILSSEPSCYSAMIDEWPQLVRTDAARRVADMAEPIECFVLREMKNQHAAIAPPPPHRVANAANRAEATQVLLHGHCHQKALSGTADALALLNHVCGGRATEINSGCCGMAGSFGHEAEHYDVARAMGEHRLFPAVRARGSAQIAVTGFSCRHQIAHHTGAQALHVMEIVAERLGVFDDVK